MLDCKELTGKQSAEKYELNCKRKSKKKKSVGKNAVRQESVGKHVSRVGCVSRGETFPAITERGKWRFK